MQNFPFALTFKREWNNSAMVINSNCIPLMWQSLSHRLLNGLCQLIELHTEIPFLQKPGLLWDTTHFPSTTSISVLWHLSPKSQLGMRSWSKGESMTGEQLRMMPLGWHSCRVGWCLCVHPGPVLYGHVRYLKGKGLHEFVPCLQAYHLTRYWSLALQVSRPASMFCNTMEPNCTLRTPKSCVCFLSIRYSWHKISQWLLFKAGFPLHLPTGCCPKCVILSKKSSAGWPSNIGHRKGSL